MSFGFSHLVVNGCSFTYCQGLTDPLNEGWPKQLADKLGIPIVNLSLPGCGNDRILRTTTEYLYLNPLPNPLYVISFSHSSRREEYFISKKDYGQLHIHNKANLTEYEKAYLVNFDEIEYMKTKMRIWLHLTNTFKANNINYLTTDFIPDTLDDLVWALRTYNPLWKAINEDTNRIKNLNELTYDFPKLPCGHEDYPAMPIISNYIYEEIRKRWL